MFEETFENYQDGKLRPTHTGFAVFFKKAAGIKVCQTHSSHDVHFYGLVFFDSSVHLWQITAIPWVG